ncbi:LytR/AlgR family response regulator transcription factor [Autumnicola psychrophila]|uniref:LytTR family DNA-binding domain-containing protein n=1 Tax=Autumnicola psychrophila TaxID=3075592 RepID=A0ABU3DRD1_9FLAO|nr:LytTR family DNA-binding domain-containing protein [Zunongwangia sp. F225]MDT0686039.1 LytTR family DNA-binding domain-containing protein [Zunongwangia sp. F225]
MRALIIDDEELARKRILNLLEEVPEIMVSGECSNGKTAIIQINDLKPDLIFLDINMKDMNGFEVLQEINISPKPLVIFVTAYDNYATKAFDVDAFDFLLKPFKDQRFFKTISKILNISRSEADSNFEKKIKELFKIYSREAKEVSSPGKIPIKQGNKTMLLDPAEISYIIASGCYAEIFTDNKKHVLRESLNNLEEMLDENIFFRIHRSTIVNLNHVKEIVHSEYSEIDARMTDDKLLHISKSNKKQFLEKIGI